MDIKLDTSINDLAPPWIEHLQDRNNVAQLSRAGTLDFVVQEVDELVLEVRSEVGRMQGDDFVEVFLPAHCQLQIIEYRTRGTYEEEHDGGGETRDAEQRLWTATVYAPTTVNGVSTSRSSCLCSLVRPPPSHALHRPPCILPPSMLPACPSLPWSPAAPSSRRTRVTACYCMVVDCVQSQCEVRCLTPSDKQRRGVVAPEAEVVLSTAASDCGVAVLCY